jgi:two-component system sensor histidine kinase KdpD
VQAAALARQRAARLTLRMETAEATARLREALLSSVSHDFRSPLAAIIGSSSSLLEYGERFTEEVKRDLVINIQEEAERLNEYVANLLTMARLRAGAIQANLETISVHDAVEGAKNRLAKHSRTALNLRMNGNYDLIADPLLLEQALYNILDNAMKYGNGGAGIIVSTSIEDGYCRIDIADSGPGIAQDKVDMFFERFSHHRGGSATGTGLGLSIVKGFVEGMGGTVEAKHRSDGEAGLVVSIKMPRLT